MEHEPLSPHTKDRAAVKNTRVSKKRKKTLIIVAVCAVLAAAAVILLICLLPKNSGPQTPYIADVYKEEPNRFAVCDPDAPSIFTDESYLSLDRSLHVRRGGEEYVVESADDETADPGAIFFLEYFDVLAHGETEKYNALFTDRYFENHTPQEDFPEQRVYNIHVTLLDVTPDESAAAYIVEYYINKNTGTFRRDIYSDSSRAMIFDLVLVGDSYKIDNMKYTNVED